jgi:hypothetical protein
MGIIIPTDFHIFRGVEIPPTRKTNRNGTVPILDMSMEFRQKQFMGGE